MALGHPFRAWATAGVREPDPAALLSALDRGAIGLEVAADTLAAPDGLDRLAPLLEALGDRPLLVHPGPTVGQEAERPAWWTPTVSYVNQLHAAWWAWADGGRTRFPDLPVCFVALAGLGPLHGERHRARGGSGERGRSASPSSRPRPTVRRPSTRYCACSGSTSSATGPTVPMPRPRHLALDAAALHAVECRNPARLLAHTIKEVLV